MHVSLRVWGLIGALALTALPACSASAPQPGDYVLLPPSAMAKALDQCSRSAPHASGAWTPTPEQLAAAESHLSQLSSLAARQGLPAQIADPKASFRQCVGVVVDNHRFIYVNAVPPDSIDSPRGGNRSDGPTMVCDGGPAFWGALYDPDTGTFSQLAANGVA
jgi:hypothetical protein